MPVITVQSLRPPDPEAVPRLLASLPARFSEAVGGSPNEVWVYWSPVDAADTGAHREWTGHCPLVTVRARAWRSEEDIRAGLAAAAKAVAEAFAVPTDDVWVHWVELSPGRVWAGGRLA